MDGLINPLLLYVGCGLGAVGVALALPRKGVSLFAVGAVVAAVAAGVVIVGLGVANPGALPTAAFHIFALLGLGSAVRMITHPRPVYSALYFILTIIASAGLYLLLSAEFMAFALIIIYAGAILITYLFVIMLATQAPTEDDLDSLSDYDASAREPAAGSVVGFVLLAVLTTMLFRGTAGLRPANADGDDDAVLAALPRKVERALLDELRARSLIFPEEDLARLDDGTLAGVDAEARRVVLVRRVPGGPGVDEQVREGAAESRTVTVPEDAWPDELVATNVDRIGLNLLRDHPMTIEIAGVILLMAMLGATVLARKQVDIEEAAKASEARRLGLMAEEGA